MIDCRIRLCALCALLCMLLPQPVNGREPDEFFVQLPAAELREMLAARTAPAIGLYREFLSLPNDANHPADIERLVDWMQPEFEARGFAVSRIATDGSPLLLAERTHEGATRTLLVYLQADGQPVDPAAWQQDDPYQPVLKRLDAGGEWQLLDWQRLDHEFDPDWRIFARSAADSKGPMTQFLVAIDLLQEAGIVPGYHLKVIVDTEEELGSPHLADAIAANLQRLASDLLLIFDGPPHASNKPTVSFGARGIATVTLLVHGPNLPQHSGHYGNFVPNPAQQLSRILASLEDADGRVLVDGFYDGVSIDAGTRARLRAVPDDEDAILHGMGLIRADAVAASLQEALQYPSLNIRGLRAAWVGNDARTIIPASAMAELDIRLVVESDPARMLRKLREHLAGLGFTVLDHDPSDAERLRYPRIVTMSSDLSYGAFRSDFDAEPGRMARAGMRELFGAEPVLIRTMGGSIPIAPVVELLDIPAAIVPTVNIDNNQHSPNENLRLGNFIDGIAIITSVLSQQPAVAEAQP